MSAIDLRQLRKVYPTGVVAVDSVDLTVNDGEVMVLLGPTSCGKSTILRLIAGLETPTAGQILFGGKPMDEVDSRDRGVAMVFQDYALYPHLTVADNIGFPLLAHHMDDAARQARVREVADLLGLGPLLHRRPAQLSGGQRQRVAMARAIARAPRAFLLDEPLSNLDASARETARTDILDLIHTLGVATVYVTHDQIEALCLADRIAVMRQGRVEQLGTPEEVYSDPQRLFVAAFVGNPRMNLLQAAVYAEPDERTVIDLGSQALVLLWADERARVLAEHHTARITVGIRPDALTPVSCAGEDASCIRGIVRLVEHRGHDAILHLETGSAPTPISVSQLEHPDTHGELSQIVGEELKRGHPVRDRLARIVPLHRRGEEPERYAVQPAYDPDLDLARLMLGDLTVRVPAVDLPRLGATLSLAVNIDQLFFFDRAGNRIRLPKAPHAAVGTAGLPDRGGSSVR